MIYLFAGFFVQLVWDIVGNVGILVIPESWSIVAVFVLEVLVLGLFVMGSHKLRHESKHFKSGTALSLILIAVSCITALLKLSDDAIDDSFLSSVTFILGLFLSYQLTKGIVARAEGTSLKLLAHRLMKYWIANLWLFGGLFVTLVVGMVTILGTWSYNNNGQQLDLEWFMNAEGESITILFTDVLATAGPFLIVVAFALVGFLLAYLIVRILFVITVYQLQHDPQRIAVEPALSEVETSQKETV